MWEAKRKYGPLENSEMCEPQLPTQRSIGQYAPLSFPWVEHTTETNNALSSGYFRKETMWHS